MAERGGGGGGGAAAPAAAAHVFGACDLCGEECDQSAAALVLVQCNQKACPDRVYHQDCLLDHIESVSASRRTFYLKKQTYFDLAGFLCVENRHDSSDPRHCRGKIQASEQLRELKKPKAKAAAAKPAPAARDASCGHRKATRVPPAAGVKRLVSRPAFTPAAPPAAAAALEDGPNARVPVGWEPVDEEDTSPRGPPSPRAPAAAAPGGGAVPWWLAKVEAPKRDAPAEAEEEPPSEEDTTGSDWEAAAYHHAAAEAADELALAPAPAEEAEQPASPAPDAQNFIAIDAAAIAPGVGLLPAVPASQHGLSSTGAALAANAAVRGLFRAALADVAARGLLPLPNASRLSDVMAALEPAWAQQRKRHAPFSRLFWAYAADVAAAGLALVPACDGFALIANGGGNHAANASSSSSSPVQSLAGVTTAAPRRAAVAEANEAQAAAVAALYEARLTASLANGQWRLLSMLGDRDRGCPVPHNLGCSLKQFCAARPERFELRWTDDAWKVRLISAATSAPAGYFPQQHLAPAPPAVPMASLAPNPFAAAQPTGLPPRPALPPGFQQSHAPRFAPPPASASTFLPPLGFSAPASLQTVPAIASMAAHSSSYSLFSTPFSFHPPPEAEVAQPRRLYEPYAPPSYAPPVQPQLQPSAYAQSWAPAPAAARAIFPTPMWSAAGPEAPPAQRAASAPAEAYGIPPPAQRSAALRNGAPLPQPQPQQQPQPQRFAGGHSTSPRTGRVLPAPRTAALSPNGKALPQPRVLLRPPAGQAAPPYGADADCADDDAARHEQLIALLLADFD